MQGNFQELSYAFMMPATIVRERGNFDTREKTCQVLKLCRRGAGRHELKSVVIYSIIFFTVLESA